jgi:hypothetical protein
MTDTETDEEFRIRTERLIRREAMRRAAAVPNTASPLGLEDAMQRITAEVTAEALAIREARPSKP